MFECPQTCIEKGHDKDDCKYISICIRCRGLCTEMGNDKDECPHKEDCDLVVPYDSVLEKNKLTDYNHLSMLALSLSTQIKRFQNSPPSMKYKKYFDIEELKKERDRVVKKRDDLAKCYEAEHERHKQALKDRGERKK